MLAKLLQKCGLPVFWPRSLLWLLDLLAVGQISFPASIYLKILFILGLKQQWPQLNMKDIPFTIHTSLLRPCNLKKVQVLRAKGRKRNASGLCAYQLIHSERFALKKYRVSYCRACSIFFDIKSHAF